MSTDQTTLEAFEIDCVDLESKVVVDPETVDGSSRPMFGFGKQLVEVLEE
ncbi:hypothetical protein [Haloterrigena salinisoli]